MNPPRVDAIDATPVPLVADADDLCPDLTRCQRRMRTLTGVRLHGYALVAPFDRLWEAPAWGRGLGIVAGVATYLWTDLFTSALILVIASGAFDYVLGVRLAKREKRYDPNIAHAGAISKASGILLMMLVRMAEHWMQTADLVDTRGWIAAALTLSLFAVDLEGIQAKREALGARPIPGLSTLTVWMHSIITRVLPSTPMPRHMRDRDPDDGDDHDIRAGD